jgi:hypothetical protein
VTGHWLMGLEFPGDTEAWRAGGGVMPWSSRFDDPIPLPDGRLIVTLRDAGAYITKLPKAEHERNAYSGREPNSRKCRHSDRFPHRPLPEAATFGVQGRSAERKSVTRLWVF